MKKDNFYLAVLSIFKEEGFDAAIAFLIRRQYHPNDALIYLDWLMKEEKIDENVVAKVPEYSRMLRLRKKSVAFFNFSFLKWLFGRLKVILRI